MPHPASFNDLHFFDPDADVLVRARRLPHWSQAGTVAFLTWRTWDSIPEHVAVEWLKERARWLTRHHIDPLDPRWRDRLTALPFADQCEFHDTFSDRWQQVLDDCHGACPLRQPGLSRVVADSLRFFDGKRYLLTDFVVMPNHVHVLVAFQNEEAMLKQCESWKHFTAVQLNKRLSRTGRFWQVDGFDHLVRSETQFRALGQYIADNPRRVGLPDGEYEHYSTERVGHSRSE